jgi:endonuclease/exonuclease/phosphatase family metal-dependent hydrolase
MPTARKILFSNIGYAKGIDGSLWQHVAMSGRHLYCPVPVQQQVLNQLRAIIQDTQPDLCCFVEVDSGSFHSAGLNHIEALMDETYHFHDIAAKYGEENGLHNMWFHRGKSNGFIARDRFPFERLYFKNGTKRLIYKIGMAEDVMLYFAHFSLNRQTRIRQFEEIKALVGASGDVIILADFNIMAGFGELKPLIESGHLRLMNNETEHTFTFHKRKRVLDLCLCSASLAGRVSLRVIPQPFSDHAALLVELQN